MTGIIARPQPQRRSGLQAGDGSFIIDAGGVILSLAVAGILSMNVVLDAVSQRTTETALLKALGVPAHAIHAQFLREAAVLSLAGASIGLGMGELGS